VALAIHAGIVAYVLGNVRRLGVVKGDDEMERTA
jgi:hypothetical protein